MAGHVRFADPHYWSDAGYIQSTAGEMDPCFTYGTGAKRREWMGLGVAEMIIASDYGSFPHSLSTSKMMKSTFFCGLTSISSQ